jgi:hypothetical protein
MSKLWTQITSTLAVVFALIFAVIYVASAWFLYHTYGQTVAGDEKAWDHAWAIFAGIQSAGLSAIGVLLGVAVQQPRVADARDVAKRATDKAEDAQKTIEQVRGAVGQVLAVNRSAAEKGGVAVATADSIVLTNNMRELLEGVLAK